MAFYATNRPEDWLHRRFWRLAHSGKGRRWTSIVREVGESDEWQIAIMALWLVEMSARPASARALEWLVALSFRHTPGPWRPRAMSITVGPLQISGGRWSARFAIRAALDRLRWSGVHPRDIESIGRCWNGSCDEAQLSFPYIAALDIARSYAARMVRETVGTALPGPLRR